MCLENIIGIRSNCGDSTPESPYFIEDLPGIDIYVAGDIASPAVKNGWTLLQDKINFASELVQDEFSQVIQQHVRLTPILEVSRVGMWNEDDWLASEAADKGIEICIQQSSLAKIHVHKIHVLANTTILGKTVSITDGATTTNYSVDLVANVPAEIDVDTTFTRDKIFIHWDTSDVAPNDSNFDLSNCTKCGGKQSKTWKSKYASVTGRVGASDGLSGTYGLSADFDIECDSTVLVCKLRRHLHKAMLYRTGMEFIKEHLSSSRFNAITSLHRETAAELLQSYTDEYHATIDHFADMVAPVISSMDRRQDGCVLCRKSKVITLVP